MVTYCADKFDKYNKINNLKTDNYRLLTTYPFIDFYRFPIQSTNFYRLYQLLSIIGFIDWTSREERNLCSRGNYDWKPILIVSLVDSYVMMYYCPANSGAPNDNFRKNICSEDDLRSRIFGTFVVKFLASLPLLGFSNF